MANPQRVDRARRNALKAATLVGAFLASTVVDRHAEAAGNNGNGKGGCGKGQQTNGCGDGGGNCFARGTLVRVRDGYRAIETLAKNDEVAVRNGGFAPIKAVVSHTLKCAAGEWVGDAGNLPVILRRSALDENVPAADTCVTAMHPVYIDGFLMPAGDLVNGTSISWKAPAEGEASVDFFNIELDGHDILDVQGAFFESLHRPGVERCAPLLRFYGGRDRLQSHWRSMVSVVIDRRQPIDILRDHVEERSASLARAA